MGRDGKNAFVCRYIECWLVSLTSTTKLQSSCSRVVVTRKQVLVAVKLFSFAQSMGMVVVIVRCYVEMH